GRRPPHRNEPYCRACIRFSNSSEAGCALATAKELPPQITSGAGLRRNCYPVAVLRGSAVQCRLAAIRPQSLPISPPSPPSARSSAARPCAPGVRAAPRACRCHRDGRAAVPSAPRPREAVPEGPPGASGWRVRRTAELAIAPSLRGLVGAGECAVDGVVRLEAV